MLGESNFGIYVAYGAICLFLLIVIVMFVRLAIMLSLLFLSPAAEVARRLTGRQKNAEASSPATGGDRGSESPTGN
jgi:hypothetical protein